MWLVQAPWVPHSLGTQKGGVEQIRINKSKKRLLSIAFRRADRGPRPIDRPIDSLLQQPSAYAAGTYACTPGPASTVPVNRNALISAEGGAALPVPLIQVA